MSAVKRGLLSFRDYLKDNQRKQDAPEFISMKVVYGNTYGLTFDFAEISDICLKIVKHLNKNITVCTFTQHSLETAVCYCTQKTLKPF